MPDKGEQQFVVALSDLMRLLKRHRGKIILGGIICFLLGGLFALTRPIKYEAYATFRDKKNSETGMPSAAKLLLFKDSETHAEAVSLLRSRKLLRGVVNKLHLQGTIKKNEPKIKTLFTRAMGNLQIEQAYWKQVWKPVHEPVLVSEKLPLRLEAASYTVERDCDLILHFASTEDFLVKDECTGELLGAGTLGKPFQHDTWKFIVIAQGSGVKEGQEYRLRFEPLATCIDALCDDMEIAADGKDAGLIELTYKHRDRHQAAHIVNALMIQYRQQLSEDRNHWTKVQLDYLEQRQNETAAHLKTLMDDHAASVTNDLFSTGLFDLDKETEFLATQQLSYRQALANVDLQLKRLQVIQNDAETGFANTHCALEGDAASAIVLDTIRELKKQRDTLCRNCSQTGDEESDEMNSMTNDDSEEHTSELEGIALETANELYQKYCTSLDGIQKSMREQEFILQEFEHPAFEINSLSIVPTDVVTQSIVAKSIELALSLRDENNRSVREQERVKEALSYQKNFLAAHLEQSLEILRVNEQLTKEKISYLRNKIVSLIDRELVILQKHLEDSFATQSTQLKQERLLLENRLQELHAEMRILPRKWVSEQILQMRVESDQECVKEITKLVESKNLSKNLEVVQSGPLDIATPPFLPASPKIILTATLGGGVGAFLVAAFVLVQGVLIGIPASPVNLALASQSVAGTLSFRCQGNRLDKVGDGDLETLRNLATSITSSSSKSSVLAILGHTVDYTSLLAALLTRGGKKVVTMSIDFDATAPAEEIPGLLQVLEGENVKPRIASQGGHDHIFAGGLSLYGPEMIASERFQHLLKELMTSYDVVIAVTKTDPESSSAQSFFASFPSALVSVDQHTQNDLKPYMQASLDPTTCKQVTFLFSAHVRRHEEEVSRTGQ